MILILRVILILLCLLCFDGHVLLEAAENGEQTYPKIVNYEGPLFTQCLEITHRGGAPGDPAVRQPVEPRFDFTIDFNLSASETWQKIAYNICLGGWWEFFYNNYPIILEGYKPYMTISSFKCGRVKVEITSSCSLISASSLECSSIIIELYDSYKYDRRQHFIFNDDAIGSCACYVVGNESWLVFMAAVGGHSLSRPTYGIQEDTDDEEWAGRFDYFYNAEYIGTFDPARASSLADHYTPNRTELNIPGLKLLATQLHPFQKPTYGSDEAHLNSLKPSGRKVKGSPYYNNRSLHARTAYDGFRRYCLGQEQERGLHTNLHKFVPLWPFPRRAEIHKIN